MASNFYYETEISRVDSDSNKSVILKDHARICKYCTRLFGLMRNARHAQRIPQWILKVSEESLGRDETPH